MTMFSVSVEQLNNAELIDFDNGLQHVAELIEQFGNEDDGFDTYEVFSNWPVATILPIDDYHEARVFGNTVVAVIDEQWIFIEVENGQV